MDSNYTVKIGPGIEPRVKELGSLLLHATQARFGMRCSLRAFPNPEVPFHTHLGSDQPTGTRRSQNSFSLTLLWRDSIMTRLTLFHFRAFPHIEFRQVEWDLEYIYSIQNWNRSNSWRSAFCVEVSYFQRMRDTRFSRSIGDRAPNGLPDVENGRLMSPNSLSPISHLALLRYLLHVNRLLVQQLSSIRSLLIYAQLWKP